MTNKELCQRFFEEALNRGNLDVIDELVADDVVSHNPFPGQAPGARGVRDTLGLFRRAFPDLRAKALHLVAEGDKVVGYFVVTGTHRGELLGRAPTGKSVRYEEAIVLRVADGKIVEHWAVADALALMEQLGAEGSPGSASPDAAAPPSLCSGISALEDPTGARPVCLTDELPSAAPELGWLGDARPGHRPPGATAMTTRGARRDQFHATPASQRGRYAARRTVPSFASSATSTFVALVGVRQHLPAGAAEEDERPRAVRFHRRLPSPPLLHGHSRALSIASCAVIIARPHRPSVSRDARKVVGVRDGLEQGGAAAVER